MALSELEEEFYSEIINKEAPEDKPVVEDVVIQDNPVIEDKPIAEILVEDKPVIQDTPAPYKSKKFIEVEDEKALYTQLHSKYQYEGMSSEQKALSFIKQQNPELDDNEVAFLAASDYNIGVEKPDEADMTDEQQIAWRKQEISRKQLLSKADAYFSEEANKMALPDYDPLDLDPDYKEYRTISQQQKAEAKEREDKINYINTEIETNAATISEITVTVEIDIDEGKLAIPINFKFTKEKQEQLADFAKRYVPTTSEYEAHNDPKTGKFDYKGYVESLAPTCFAKEIAKAGMRQALASDRTNFIEKELKNSTLRNNDTSKVVEKSFDLVDAWSFG